MKKYRYALILLLLVGVSASSEQMQAPRAKSGDADLAEYNQQLLEKLPDEARKACKFLSTRPSDADELRPEPDPACVAKYISDNTPKSSARTKPTDDSVFCTRSINRLTVTCEGQLYKKDVSGSTANALRKSSLIQTMQSTDQKIVPAAAAKGSNHPDPDTN